MHSWELREAIEQPAFCVGLGFEAGLVQKLIQDAQTQPGTLPLLQHALYSSWFHRDADKLTHQGYEAIGRIEGALVKRAEEIFLAFNPEEKEFAQLIFMRLVQPGEGTHDARRRADFSEFTEVTEALYDKSVPSSDEIPSIRGVIHKLADERLLVIEENLIDVAHEALIQAWPRLREWIESNRETLREHRRITADSIEWLRLDRDFSVLYRERRLDLALGWRLKNEAALSSLEREFLDAAAHQREEEKKQQLSEEQRKIVVQRRWLSRVSAVALLTLLSCFVALWQWQQSETQAITVTCPI